MTIENLQEAFGIVKSMQTEGLDWDKGCRPLGRLVLAETVERVEDQWLDSFDGTYRHNLPSEFGEAEDPAHSPVLPVSRVVRILDEAVEASCPLANAYKVLDGVALSCKAGAGALKRSVLVALGLHTDGRKGDYCLARAKSAAEWFFDDARGLTGEDLEMVCDSQSLLTALPAVHHGVPVQRCRAHKNILDKVRKARPSSRISTLSRRTRARSIAGRRKDACPKPSPACATISCQPASGTGTNTNMCDPQMLRRFRDIRRRTAVCRTKLPWTAFAIFVHENKQQGVPTLFSLTNKS